MDENNINYTWVVDEEDAKDLTYVQRDDLIYYEQIHNIFLRLRHVLNDSKNNDTGAIDSELADYVVNRVEEIFTIINNNNEYKYLVSKSEKLQ